MKKTFRASRSAHGSLFSYTLGFAFSILLTLCSFWVAPHLGGLAAVGITICALAQLFVQLFFFLHMGSEQSPRWNLGILLFAVTIIGILMAGTLWIMSNLARLHMHTPTTTDLYVHGVVAPQNELR